MKHGIGNSSASEEVVVRIRAARFERLWEAKAILDSAFAIEEKYDILISNYLMFESEMLSITARKVVRNTLNYREFFELRAALNLQLVNLLTSTKLLVDQLPQDVGRCLPEVANAAKQVQSRLSNEYDTHFEYRFMDALRNFVQHRGIPIHFLRIDARWMSAGEKGRMEYTLDVAAHKKALKQDGKFKASVLSEMGGSVDLKIATRRYVESLSAVVQFTRDLVAESVETARAYIQRAQTGYAKKVGGDPRGLVALEMKGSTAVRSVPLLLEWDAVRKELQARNWPLTGLRKKYVSSQSTKEK